MTYFFSQSYPDIRAKLKNLDRVPLTPQTKVLATAFKVFHSQDDKARRKNTRCWPRLWESRTLNLNGKINTHHTGGHQTPVSNVERRDTGPNSAVIPRYHLGLAQDVMLMGIG
jgi:hypothetical protein